jgi:superfamily II DNA/RNA helicase
LDFADLGLDNRLVKLLNVKGFKQSTEIQSQAIPYALRGLDLLASSKTGSGKTLAFLLPALNRMLRQKALTKKDARMLFLAPTRELAKQLYVELKSLAETFSFKSALLLGGENFNDQIKQLRQNPVLVVGTPGRVADHLEHRSIFLNGLELLVLDEADRMLDLGFSEQLKAINKSADHRKRQTLMFSATLEHAQLYSMTDELLKKPKQINIDSSRVQHQDIDQSFYLADHIEHKLEMLPAQLNAQEFNQAIVFTATRADTVKLAEQLTEQGIPCLALSGELLQNQRNNVMQDFAAKRYKVLITTDLASRGLDISNVSLVINFDLPKFTDEYVHRVGRTGRAGNTGKAASFVGPKDWRCFEALEKYFQKSLEPQKMEGLEATFTGLAPIKTKTAIKKAKTQGAKPAKTKKPTKHKKRVMPSQNIDMGHAPILRRKRAEADIDPDTESD